MWEPGEALTAEKLNRLADAVRLLERRTNGKVASRPQYTRAYTAEVPVVRGWEVRRNADGTVRVWGGRVWCNYGTRSSEERVADWRAPFDGWQTVECRAGMVYLAAQGRVETAPVPAVPDVLEGYRGTWGQQVKLNALSFELTTTPPQGALRVWPLAVVTADDEVPVLQLQWGDLCLFEVRGLCSTSGLPLRPRADSPAAWGSAAGMQPLATLNFTAARMTAQLQGALSAAGGLTLLMGRAAPTDAPPVQPPPAPAPEPLPPGEDWPTPTPDPGGDDDDDDPDPVPKDADGYFYTAAAPLHIDARAVQNANRIAYTFAVTCGEVPHVENMDIFYSATLQVSVQNAAQTYDWPAGGVSGLWMYYGVTAEGGTVQVAWKSSFQGADDLPKEATAAVNVGTMAAAASVWFDKGFWADSEHSPKAYAGNILSYRYVGDIRRTGYVRVKDSLTGKWRNERKVRKFRHYEVSLRLGVLREVMRHKLLANAPEGTVAPPQVVGSCTNIDPPVVRAGQLTLQRRADVSGATEVTGPLVPDFFGLGYESALPADATGNLYAAVRVRGSAAWNSNTEHGEIDDAFTVTVPAGELRAH